MSVYYDPDFFAPSGPEYDIDNEWYDSDTLYECVRDEGRL